MESNTLTAAQLRKRLAARGIPVARFAVDEAHTYPPTKYNVLSGAQPLGPALRARIEDAIVRLGLDKEEPPAKKNWPDGPLFTIRRL